MKITCDICKEEYESGLINYANHKCNPQQSDYKHFDDWFNKNMIDTTIKINLKVSQETLKLYKKLLKERYEKRNV